MEAGSRDEHPHRDAHLVLWDTCQGYVRGHYKACSHFTTAIAFLGRSGEEVVSYTEREGSKAWVL